MFSLHMEKLICPRKHLYSLYGRKKLFLKKKKRTGPNERKSEITRDRLRLDTESLKMPQTPRKMVRAESELYNRRSPRI